MAASPRTSLIALILVVLTGMIGFGIFIPIFPFLALHLGASATATTIAMGAYSFGQLLAAPFWGFLSDRLGRKPILIVGLIGSSISYLMLAQADSVAAMGLARLFGGLMAGNVGAAFAAATDLADDKTRARNMGLLGAAFALGFIIGPAVGALLVGAEASAADYRMVCLAAAGFSALAVVVAAFSFAETLPHDVRRARETPRVRRTEILRARPLLARFIAIAFVMTAAQALMESTFGLWAERALRWGPLEVGWTFAGLGATAAVVQGGAAGRLAALMGERRMLMAGLALFATGFAFMSLARTAAYALPPVALIAIGASLAGPALNSLVGGEARDEDRGVVMGMNQSAAALGRVVGPAVSGVIFDRLGHSAPYAVGAALLSGAFFLAFAASPPRPRVGGRDDLGAA
jgi:DHA1 family tetracycline resistance protein-like MFS transporter